MSGFGSVPEGTVEHFVGVDALGATIKGHWPCEVGRSFIGSRTMVGPSDPQTHTAAVTRTDSELADAVRRGRPVYVLPLGELFKQARERWQTEVRAAQQERASRALSRSRTSPRRRSA
jgi:hypothetical protein